MAEIPQDGVAKGILNNSKTSTGSNLPYLRKRGGFRACLIADNGKDSDVQKLQRVIDNLPSTYQEGNLKSELIGKHNFCAHQKRFLFASTSIGFLNESSTLRQSVVWLVTWKRFDHFVLALILANSLTLAMTDYSQFDPNTEELITEGSWRNSFVEAADPIFTTLFTVECALKIIAMGLVGSQGAYLRDPWNWLDFLVAASGVLSILPSIPKVSALRTFRVLRPLRSLNAIAGMKRLVGSLLKSIPELINVVAFLVFLFCIFGIFGIQLWSGELHGRCRMTPFPVRINPNQVYPLETSYVQAVVANPVAYQCQDDNGLLIPLELEGWTHDTSSWASPRYCIWPIAPHLKGRVCELGNGGGSGYSCPENLTCGSNYDSYGNPRFTHGNPTIASRIVTEGDYTLTSSWGYTNFDHFGYAFLSIFQCITMEGWVDIMYMIQDAGYGAIAALYFVVLIFVGAFFMLNLTLAVIWDNFSQANEVEDEDEIRVKNVSQSSESGNLLLNSKTKTKQSLFVKVTGRIANHWAFSFLITFFIVVNTITLSLDQYPSDPEVEYYVEVVNFFLTMAFTLETCIKIVGLGLLKWSFDRMNLFDAFIVFVSLMELILTPPEFITSDSVGAGALSALRTFRLFRIFKLARSWTSLQNLLVSIMKTVSQIGNFSVLLVLFMYIYSLIGMQFFAYKYRFDKSGYPVSRLEEDAFRDAIIPRSHFDDLLSSFVTIFQILTAENWNIVMYDGWRSTGWSSIPYFVSLVVLGNFIVLNLFLAILLGNFQPTSTEVETMDTVGSNDGSNNATKKRSFTRERRPSMKVEPLKIPSSLPPTQRKSFRGETQVKRYKEKVASSTSKAASSTPLSSRIHSGTKNKKRSDKLVKQPVIRKATTVVPEASELGTHKRCSAAAEQRRLNQVLPQGKSLYAFEITHPIRVISARIALSRRFENFILVLILLSSLALALDNPLLDPESTLASALGYFDTLFTAIFLLEMVLKVICFGFLLHKKSYLRNGWNVLDFFIVCISLLLLAVSGNSKLKSLRTLRTLRALRPLRMISRNPGLKLVVNALFASIPQIFNVVMVCLLFFTIFSIVGVNYFKGKFYSCRGTEFDLLSEEQIRLITFPLPWSNLTDIQRRWFGNSTEFKSLYEYEAPVSRSVCTWIGAQWGPTINQNFNNVFNGIGTLFEMSTTEQWVDVMFTGIDATEIDMQPIRDNNPVWSMFFVAFMVVGSFFMMQLFVGVVIDNFNRMKVQLGDSVFLTASQKEWVHMQGAMMKLKPLRRKRVPTNRYRRRFYHIASDPSLEIVVMAFIVTNTMIMTFSFFGQGDDYTAAINMANYIFNALFFIEAVIKLIGLGKHYWTDWWNIFDLSIVIGSTAGIVLNLAFGISGGSVTTAIRTFRVGRVFRLIKSAPTLNQLFNTLLITLPSLGNIGTLLMIMYFIYSIMGMQLFAVVKHGEYLTDQANFESFGTAMLTLIRSSTGENWNGMMYDCMIAQDCNPDPTYNTSMCGYNNFNGCIPLNGCGSPVAFLYFSSFTLIVTFVLLNVFIAVILEGFSSEKEQTSSTLTEEEYDAFVHVWAHFDPEATCFIDWKNLFSLLQKLEPPMGFGKHKVSRKEIYRLINSLGIPVYKGNKVFFSDVSQRIARHIIQSHYGETLQPLPSDHNIVRKWQQLTEEGKNNSGEQEEYGLNHFYAGITIHSAFKNYRFRNHLQRRVTDFISKRRDNKTGLL